MKRNAKQKPEPQEGIDLALARLRDVMHVPNSTMALVEKTIASGIDIPVLTFSLNSVFHDWYRDIKNKRHPDFKKINREARDTVENICLLVDCDGLSISMSNFFPVLDQIELLKKGQRVSKLTPENLHLTRSMIHVLSVWRENGGSSSWRRDAPMVFEYVKQYHDDIDRLISAIRSSGSISGRLVGELDSISSPVLEGAL